MFVNDQILVEQPPPAPRPRLFLKIRALLLSCLIFLSFVWIVLLCITIFTQWDLMDRTERSLILVMMFIDTLTTVMLPILLLLPFRPWLDAARFLFIWLSHSGIAILFVIKKPSIQCSSLVSDQDAVCGLIILFLIITSWFIPALAGCYICGLFYLVRRLSKVSPDSTRDIEEQSTKGHKSLTSSTTQAFYDCNLKEVI